MAGQGTREVVVHASVEDVYDGTVRLLGDAQRFGLDLQGMCLKTGQEGASVLTLTLRVPEHVDDSLLASRFARHPAVIRVAVGPLRVNAALEQLAA